MTSVDCERLAKKLPSKDAFRSCSSSSSGCSSVDEAAILLTTTIEMKRHKESLTRSKSLARIQRVRFKPPDEAKLPLEHPLCKRPIIVSASQFSVEDLQKSIRAAKYNTLDPRQVTSRIQTDPINQARAKNKQQHRRSELILGLHDNWHGCHECCSMDDKRQISHQRAKTREANNGDHGLNRIIATTLEFTRQPKDTKSKPQFSKHHHSKVHRPRDTLRQVNSGPNELKPSESSVHFRSRPTLLPVPPPVIPLYKELEIFGHRAKEELAPKEQKQKQQQQLQLQLERRQTVEPKSQQEAKTENDSINYHCNAINEGSCCAEIYENIAKYDHSYGNSLDANEIIDELDIGAKLRYATKWEDLHERRRFGGCVSPAVGHSQDEVENNHKIGSSADQADKCIKTQAINEISSQKRHHSLTQSRNRKCRSSNTNLDDSSKGQHNNNNNEPTGFERHVEKLNGSKGLNQNLGWKMVVRRLKQTFVSSMSLTASNQSTTAAADMSRAPNSKLHEAHETHEAPMDCDSQDKTARIERLLAFDRDLKTRQTLSQSAGNLFSPDANHAKPSSGASIGPNMSLRNNRIELHNTTAMDNNDVYDTPEYNANYRLTTPARPSHGPKPDSALNAQRPSIPPPPPPPMARDECRGSTNSVNSLEIYRGFGLSADCAIAAPLDDQHSISQYIECDLESRHWRSTLANANESLETKKRPQDSESNLILETNWSAYGESRPTTLSSQGERQTVRTFEANPSTEQRQISTSSDTISLASNRKSPRHIGLNKNKSESISNLQFQLSKDILISTEKRYSKDKGKS